MFGGAWCWVGLGGWGLGVQDENSEKVLHMPWHAADAADCSGGTPGAIALEDSCKGAGLDGESGAGGCLTRFELEFLFHEVRGADAEGGEAMCVHASNSGLCLLLFHKGRPRIYITLQNATFNLKCNTGST